MNAIEGRELFRSFGATPALRGATVSVAEGEMLAIMGPSGSGKSTLLHCLAAILTPDRGEVWFGGQRIDTLGETARSTLRRMRFGFVFQFGQLVPELTAVENVALPLLLDGTHRKAALAQARPWFGRLGLPGASKVTSIQTIPPSGCNGPDCLLALGIGSNGIDLILSCVAAGLLFPVLIFIGTASRLSAARREQRFAAMCLAGATPRQVSVISAVESAVAAVLGLAGGFGLFYALRPAIAAISFTGAPFFTSDLSLSLADVLS